MTYRHLAALVLVVASAACASSGTASTADGARPAASTSRNTNRNLLTQDELRAGPHTTMLDAINALRPQWMRATNVTSLGGTAGSGLTVFVDGSVFGSADAMRTLEVRTVATARYLSVAEAQNRYGLRVGTPVIDIQLVH